MSEQSEQPRRRRRQPQPPTPPGQGSVARGAVLVAIAVVIGVLLLRDDDSSTTQVAVGSDQAGDVDGGTVEPEGDGDTDASTTTTTAAPRDPAEVKVLVANGSGVDGAAGGATDALEALGYVTGTPANADRVQATIVYFTTGFESEADALAAAIGAPAESVTPMPAVAPVDDLQLANVLVHLGPDLGSAG
jgi:hypothetical protein